MIGVSVNFNMESFSDKLSRKLKEALVFKLPKPYKECNKYTRTHKAKEQASPDKKTSKQDKLKGKKWQSIRADVISELGVSCLKCGITPPIKDLHIDHIKPKSKYPELIYDKGNLQVLCRPCNFDKSNSDETDYRV